MTVPETRRCSACPTARPELFCVPETRATVPHVAVPKTPSRPLRVTLVSRRTPEGSSVDEGATLLAEGRCIGSPI